MSGVEERQGAGDASLVPGSELAPPLLADGDGPRRWAGSQAVRMSPFCAGSAAQMGIEPGTLRSFLFDALFSRGGGGGPAGGSGRGRPGERAGGGEDGGRGGGG